VIVFAPQRNPGVKEVLPSYWNPFPPQYFFETSPEKSGNNACKEDVVRWFRFFTDIADPTAFPLPFAKFYPRLQPVMGD